MFGKIFRLLADDPVKSWNAHAFLSWAFGIALGVVAHVLGWPVAFWVAIGWVAAYVFYRLREWLDEYKYKQVGTWRRRRRNNVTPEIDGKGDILGPRWVALAGLASFLLTRFL